MNSQLLEKRKPDPVLHPFTALITYTTTCPQNQLCSCLRPTPPRDSLFLLSVSILVLSRSLPFSSFPSFIFPLSLALLLFSLIGGEFKLSCPVVLYEKTEHCTFVKYNCLLFTIYILNWIYNTIIFNQLLAANSPGMPRWISPSQTSHSFLGGTVAKNLPANAGDSRDAALIPGSGRSPGVRNGNPLQYSFLENSMDRGAWWAIQFMGCKESDMTEHMNTHTHRHVKVSLSSKEVCPDLGNDQHSYSYLAAPISKWIAVQEFEMMLEYDWSFSAKTWSYRKIWDSFTLY